MRRLAVLVGLLTSAACGSSTTTVPSSTTPTIPSVTTFTLTGTITSAGGGGIAGALIRIIDGANAGRNATTPDASGVYSMTGLSSGGFNVDISAPNFVAQAKAVNLSGNTTVSAALLPSQLYTRSGSGNNVFDMPTYISRIRIQGTFTGFCCSNFIVKIGGKLTVNDIIGPSENSTVSDGTYLTTGGTVEITNSSGVSWTFTEVRQ